MASKIRTFVDANVLISATNINDALIVAQIIKVLNDSQREFVANDFLELEVLPKPVFNRRQLSIAFCEDYFQHCARRIGTNRKLLKIAFDEACRLGLSAMDAIHVASAHLAHAAELITLEKKTKPIYRTNLVSVIYLHDVK
jgi:predicted nucleic acid-binding protein